MIFRHLAGSVAVLTVFALTVISPAVAETGFSVLPGLNSPGYEVTAEADTDEKRRNNDAVWGLAGAGVVAAVFVTAGSSGGSTGSESGDGSGDWYSDKFRDNGITSAPEPSSIALLAGGAIPIFGLLRRRRSN